MISVCYITNRIQPQIGWFFDSLHRECKGDYSDLTVIVVDYFAAERHAGSPRGKCQFVYTTPKPCVWQGPHRLTKKDYFAAANARNTALCLAPDGHIAFVDDLSVLLPGWLNCVRQSQRENYIALGTYQKVKCLEVKDGLVVSFAAFPEGIDSRSKLCSQPVTSCGGNWLYGCSFAAPVEALLDVNGSDENCDSTGIGSEDYCLGIRIGNLKKYSFRYDKRMMTYESEEGHRNPVYPKGTDKGVSPNDKSHSILRMAQQSKWAPNYFGEGGIRALRQKALAGEPFPVCQIPQHDFFDGQSLSEL